MIVAHFKKNKYLLFNGLFNKKTLSKISILYTFKAIGFLPFFSSFLFYKQNYKQGVFHYL